MTRAAPAGPHTVRRHNLALVLDQIASDAGANRSQLALVTGLTRATVSTLVDELLGAGLVAALDAPRGGRGRPGSPLVLRPDGGAGVGLEVNVDYLAACLVDLSGAVRWHQRSPGEHRGLPPSTVLRRVGRLAERAVDQARALGLPVSGAKLAVPGIVDAGQQVRRAPNLPGWEGLAIIDVLGERLTGTAVALSVDNEANLAALAELWYGGRPERRDFIHVSGEIGIGAGIVLSGSLFRGPRGYAGELGHVTVAVDGPRCGCGARGCLERFAGQDALLDAAGVRTVDALIDDAATPGRAEQVIREAGRSIGVALASVVNVVDVPCVVLGGLYARLGRWLVEPIAEELAARVISAAWMPVQVQVSVLGADAAVRGAAGSVVRRILADPASGLART